MKFLSKWWKRASPRSRLLMIGVGIVIVATVVGLVTVVNRDSSASETNPSGDSPLFGPIDDGFVRRYLGTESPSSNEYGVVFEDQNWTKRVLERAFTTSDRPELRAASALRG